MSAISLCGGQEDASSCVCLHVLSDPSAHVEVGLDMRVFLLPLACSSARKSQPLADRSACSGLPPASGFGLLSN